ncbi:MAG: DUF58 domain-containing protein [Chitinispirillia bacterium]|nr:DUF58 domain-containing protein [Chitinispirillia bacterium]MCL2268821.1 DUF58 domain-containing protein [Chitinispirillia bacterium]
MIPKEVLQKVRQIEIRTRRIVDSVMSGEYHSAFKGRGMEFSEVRQYMDGDDVRTIDWNVTARMGSPYIKKYIEERELTVMLVVDASSSGNFGSINKFKGEMAVELCSLLAFSAIRNNDRVGLVIFTSDIEVYIPPRKGKNHVLRVIRELLYFQPKHKGTDIGNALKFLNQVQTKTSVVFLVSDFISANFETPLRVAAKRHDLVAISITDPREESIPRVGLIELEDAETGESILFDTRDKKSLAIYRREIGRRREKLDELMRTTGVDEIRVSTDTGYVTPIVKFFRNREKILR